MKSRLNPMQIAGFDVLLFGRVKGRSAFVSLARAKKILIRPKGSKDDWLVLDVSKLRTKAEKQKVLTRTLINLTKKRDVESEAITRARVPERVAPKKVKPPKKEKKKRKKKEVEEEEVPPPPPAEPINFILQEKVAKAIKTRAGKYLDIEKYYFYNEKPFEFIHGKELDQNSLRDYIQAVKQEFLKQVYKTYGPKEYLIRLFHDYDGLPNKASELYPDKGFGGKSLNRQPMKRKDVNEQFDRILPEEYVDNYTTYLRRGSNQTYFRFIGFSVEVTKKVLKNGQV